MVTIFMKPTNSPTQGQPSPRKMRLNKWHSGHFLPQQIIFHWFQIGTRLQETQTNHTVRKRPNDRLVLIFPVWSLHFPFGPYISRLVLTFPAWSLPGMFPVWSLHFPLGPYLVYFPFGYYNIPLGPYIRVFAENLVGLGFFCTGSLFPIYIYFEVYIFVVCFLYKINPSPRK